MMYFAFALVALLCWSGSDLFSKKGTNEKDPNSHWKVTFAVGLIMGIHFIITLIGGAIIDNAGGPDSVPKFVASLFYTDFMRLAPQVFQRSPLVLNIYIYSITFF